MNGKIQSGTHPDAESLNAFAEQALAGQEREQIAAHLAVCPHCREVVFLAQSASGELEPAMVVTAAMPRNVERTPWYINLRLAWIPAAALAMGISIAFFVHTRREEPARQVAQIEKQGTPVVSVTQSLPQQPAAEAAKKANPVRRRIPVTPKDVEPMVSALPPPANAPRGMSEGALQGPVDGLKPASQVAQAEKSQGYVRADAMREVTVTAAEPALEVTAARSAAAAPVMQLETASAQLAKSSARREQSSSLAMLKLKQAGLPSGLVAVSRASSQQNVLAVDKDGGVFLSTDAGGHWESIGRQWNGKAVAVRTAPQIQEAATGGAKSSQVGFELVNDQGQVWVSADGRNWNPK
jgi:hypothetical protein